MPPPLQVSAQVGFDARRDFKVGGRSASAVADADFDCDGKRDLAFALRAQYVPTWHDEMSDHDQVVILRGDPSNPGEFLTPDATVDDVDRFDVGSIADANPIAIATGLFDSGSIPDVVCANAGAGSSSSNISIIYNPLSGSSTISTHSVPYPPRAVVAADFTGDGKADIAVACGTSPGQVAVFMNDGSGSFSQESGSPYDMSGNDATGIGAHDFSGDGRIDFAVVTRSDKTLRFLKRKSSNDGFNVISGAVLGLEDPAGLTVGEVDSSIAGPEILIPHDDSPDEDALTVVRQTSPNVFTSSVVDVGGPCVFAGVGSFGGGTEPDIIVIHTEHDVDVELNSFLSVIRDGTGGFLSPVHFHTALEPSGFVLFDADGSNGTDVIVAGAAQESASGRPEPSFVAVHLNSGTSTTFVSDVVSSIDVSDEALENGRRLILANLNPGDSADASPYLDAVCAAKSAKKVLVSYGKAFASGSGYFNFPHQLGLDQTGGLRQPRDIAVGDIGGDGDADIVTADEGASPGVTYFDNFWYPSGNRNSFGRHTLPGHPTEANWLPQSVLLLDWSGDGNADLIVGARKAGNPNTTPKVPDLYRLLIYRWVPTSCTPPPCILEHFTLVREITLENSPHDIEAAHLNPSVDGYVDLAIALRAKTADGFIVDEGCDFDEAEEEQRGGLAVIWGSANSFSATVTYFRHATLLDPRNVVIGDFDGNDDPDVALPTHCNDGVTIYTNGGSGSFTFVEHHAVGSWPNSIEAADLDLDSNVDLVISNYDSNNLSILHGNGDGTFDAPYYFGVGTENYFLDLGDIDFNSRIDLVTVNSESDDIAVVLNEP